MKGEKIRRGGLDIMLIKNKVVEQDTIEVAEIYHHEIEYQTFKSTLQYLKTS